MKYTLNILRILSRHTVWWTAGLIVLLAILVTAARLLLPQLENYRQQLEMTASAAVGQPVSIRELEVGWHGLGPRLVLRDVKLFDRSGTQELLGVANAYIDISVPNSLYQYQLEFGDLTIAGVVLNVVRRTDGRYELEGMSLDQKRVSDTSGVLKWLLRQPRLVLKDSLVRWRDERSDTRFEFSQVNLHLYNRGNRHQLGGEVVLPETMGNTLAVRIDARGDVNRPDELQANFYLKGAGLKLAQWLVDHPALGLYVVNGNTDLELWGMWQQQQLHQVRGEVGLYDFYLARKVESESGSGAGAVAVKRLPSLSGRFVWQGDGNEWQLEMNRVRFGGGWPPSRIHVAQKSHEGERLLEIAGDFAQLQSLAELGLNSGLLPEEQRVMLLQLQPRGDLRDFYLKLKLQPEHAPDYFVRARVENFGVDHWRRLPGVDGVDLQFNLDQHGGVADLVTEGGALDSQGLFRESLALDTVQGRVAWQKGVKGWNIGLRQITVTNTDLEVGLEGGILLPADDASPVVNLRAQISRGDGAATSRYLPVGIMHESTVAWLDRGIVGGQVTSGTMVLQGPLRHFPFVDGTGRFEVGFNVSGGIIDYADGWPRVEEADAEVKFAGNSMTIHGHGGKVLAADIKDVQLGIADFKAQPAHLMLSGEAQGSTDDVLQFLNKSPLQQRFGQFTSGSEASGRSHLGLSLDIPLKGGEKITTDGWVTFDDSSFDMKRFGVDLAAINGRMAFSDHGLSAEPISAEVMGQPAQVTIHTSTQGRSKGSIIFDASGVSRLEALAQRIKLPIFPYLKGESAWRARLEIPHNNTVPTLRVVSQLDGMAVTLPKELGKPATVSRSLDLRGEFGAKSTLWRFDYGKVMLSGVFESLRDDEGAHLNRAELRLAQVAQLPSTPGFRVAGFMDHFDYEVWRPVFSVSKQEAVPSDGSVTNPSKSVSVTDLDLTFNSARIFGQSLNQVKLQASRLPAAWSAQVESQELGGVVTVPDDLKSPLEMDLTHLYINAAEEGADKKSTAGAKEAKRRFNPEEVPPLRIKSGDTRYGKAHLGRMDLVTVRHANGMNIDTLLLESDIATINLKGGWTRESSGGGDGRDLSQLSGTFDTRDLGRLLSGFGFVETLKKGKGRGSIDLKWDDPLIDPVVAHLEGVVKFDLNDGRLLEVSPGAGRFFGLLSVQALPRRLKLDFSDFFGKGLAFDYMRGQFDFKNGNAVTSDFVLDGPAAKVELQGRLGLAARDYDQQLKVVPHASSSLPLAGAVVGGVGMGAAVLLMESLLQSKIEDATEAYYHISGNWDAPVIERLER